VHVLEEEELARVEYVPGGQSVQTAAPVPPSASATAGGNGDTGDGATGDGVTGGATGDGVTGGATSGTAQSELNQLQLPPALTQAPSDDAVGPPVWHDPWAARVHQPQFGDIVHELQDGCKRC
jgi:hypothetical protein